MSKKRRYQPLASSQSKNRRAQLGVAPEAVLVARGHVVRDDVEHHPEPGRGELAERLLAAELVADPRRVDDVVAVRRAVRRLQRGREVEVRDAEVAQVRHDRERVAEAERRPRAGGGRRARQVTRAVLRSTTDRAPLEGHEPARREHAPLRLRLEGRELERPAAPEPARRQREHDRPVPRVEEEQERVVDDRLALRRRRRDLPAVQEDAEHVRVAAAPVGLRHPAPVRPEPPDVRRARAQALAPLEEARPAEDAVVEAERITRFVNSSSSSSASSQWNHDSSLSWHHALLFPCCVRPISSPPSSIGTPCESSSVTRKLRCWRRRSATISGSSVGPSTPWFHERLSSVPSRLPSPFASLCFWLYETRSASVKPSWAVTKLIEANGLRPSSAYRSDEPVNRWANAATFASPPPEVAHGVAVDPVPLRPEHREVADLVAARADVPRLRDQLHLGEHRVLVDRVEEGREAVDVVELARERRGEVEAEAVDVALDHEVAQRVHDQPQHRRMDGVERVARPGEVHVEAPVVGHEPVVARVVDALEREHRAEVVALGGVVVDDVEDHLDPGAVERLHHPLELAHLLAARARRRVEGVRREEADRGVAPVVGQAALGEELLVGDVVHREQLDGGDAEVAEVRDRGLGGEARVRAAQVLAHAGHQLREALHVHLVDHRLVPRRRRRPVALPEERVVDDDALRDRGGVVLVVRDAGRPSSSALGPVRQRVAALLVDRALDRLRVRVDEELRRVEAVARGRVVGAVHAVAVALPGADAGQVAVPVERRPLGRRGSASRRRLRRRGRARPGGRSRRTARSSSPRRPTRGRAGTAAGPDAHQRRSRCRRARSSRRPAPRGRRSSPRARPGRGGR